ncbi:hypothetical protein ANCDUO_14971 [Ancylostoma duodenale]|uniref:Uncharacterized protein n=1 Tax=Ancylostoma duodenale TaxID=51022 RepID=A0A0C2G1S1_9BILA|nr:hypothetical protein ANCDUO_14971 [Ancylostoma duodenale]
MDTPVAAPGLVHRKPVKRHCIDPVGSPNAPCDLDHHAEALIKDDSLPQPLKVIIACLLEDRRRLQSALDPFRELSEEVINLRAENAKLKASAVGDQSSLPAPPPVVTSLAISISKSPCRSFEEIERARSIVIAGIPKSRAELSSARVHHDYDCIRDVMDFLAVECSTIAAYHMGTFNGNRPRLLKGLYIRPSLPKAERERLRVERNARRSAVAKGLPPPSSNVSSEVAAPNPTPQHVAGGAEQT